MVIENQRNTKKVKSIESDPIDSGSQVILYACTGSDEVQPCVDRPESKTAKSGKTKNIDCGSCDEKIDTYHLWRVEKQAAI